MPIGAHVGVAQGYPHAVEYAAAVGCECMQVFCKSPRRWEAAPIDSGVAEAFRQACPRRGIAPVLVHTAYLLNLGSADDALWERSIVALADELGRAQMLGAWGLVTHLGTRAGSVADTARRVARAIDRARDRSERSDVRILLENTAGAGRTFGTGPEELGAVISELTDADGVGVCLDTCHAHAAGWDLAHESEWQRLLEEFRSKCPAPVLALHANDCLFPSGERKDRHAWIGEGTIGQSGFAAMFRQGALSALPIITELGGAVPEKDVVNITRLRELRDACEGA